VKERRYTLRELAQLSDADALEYLARYPVAGGQQQTDDTDDDNEDDAENPDQTGETKDGKDSGKGKGEKVYTKDQVDAIVENAVKDRLARKDRADARRRAEENGDKDKLIEDLKKEIDEDYKPKASELETLKTEVEDLRQVVNEQIESILKDLPEELQDLDLGEDVGATKRLSWLLEKVIPKKTALAGVSVATNGNRPAGNGPGPKPANAVGKDNPAELAPIVNKKRF
jgi:vacuolar-type H+-ATPase subunit I/STV1